MTATPFTNQEMMTIAASRLVGNGDVLFAGTGISLLAAAAAKRIHAPQAVVFFETGGVDPDLEELPLAVADPRVMAGTCFGSGLVDAFAILAHRRLHTVALLGAAQVDRFGNINSTCLGPYARPTTRFAGSGGACDAGSLAAAVILFMEHEKRRFVERLDYLTCPGWLTGGDSRQRAGYRRGGPVAVVSDLGVMRFDPVTKEMVIAEVYPGVTVEKVQANTGFAIDGSRAVVAPAPTAEELRILREEIDPQRLILK